jgi:hypothetical protein
MSNKLEGYLNVEIQEVKLSLCLMNEALRHEDMFESGNIAPALLISALDGG